MSALRMRFRPRGWVSPGLLAVGSILLAGPGPALAQDPVRTDSVAVPDSAKKLPAAQLDALVAPIALYPDPLLAQTLVASTYPLELVQLQQWMAKHPELKDKALADSVAKQPWDPSIQSMAAVPDLVKRLADDIQWTTDLGNAFLAQQGDVMDAVQRMRSKAKANGALESNEQQKVETKTVEEKTVIVVQQTNPEVVYVPSYNPTYVYGPPVYPYPPVYYPPYTPGAAFVSFSFGFMMGAAMWGGSCCYAGWGGGNNNNIIINNNNNFNQINHNRGGAGSGNWSHNPSHRGGTPYGDRATANKYGGSAGVSDRAGRGAGVSDRAAGGAGNRAGVSDRSASGAGNRGAGVSDRSAGGAGSRAGAGGTDRIGSRDIPKSSGSRAGSSAWSGGSSGFSGSSARASSSRGSSSMGARGGSRGGGGRRR